MNNENFPVLSKRHQVVIKYYMRSQATIILKPRYLSDNYKDYLSYICEYLFKTHDKLDKDEQQEVNYRNYLQSPLQPLADNLESATYETFENDSIKYELYEESMYKAMLDKKNFGRFLQTKDCKGPQYVAMREGENQIMQEEVKEDFKGEIVVMYFGAGRGPLIRRAISAAKRAGVYD